MIHAAPARMGSSRLGIALTRRLIGSAVHRNHVKRLVREIFRRHPVRSAGFDCVVALRERFTPADSPSIRADVRVLFDRLYETANP